MPLHGLNEGTVEVQGRLSYAPIVTCGVWYREAWVWYIGRDSDINAFAGVPWILEGIMAKWKGEDKAFVTDVVSKFKLWGSGGAATSEECLNWAKELDIPVVIDIGMTEVGG